MWKNKILLVSLTALMLSACSSTGSDSFNPNSQYYETTKITMPDGSGGVFYLPASNSALQGYTNERIATGTFHGNRLAYGAYGIVVPHNHMNQYVVMGALKTAPQNIPNGNAVYTGGAVSGTDTNLISTIAVNFNTNQMKGEIDKIYTLQNFQQMFINEYRKKTGEQPDSNKIDPGADQIKNAIKAYYPKGTIIDTGDGGLVARLVQIKSTTISNAKKPELAGQAVFLLNNSTGYAKAVLAGPHAEEIFGTAEFPGHTDQNVAFGGRRSVE